MRIAAQYRAFFVKIKLGLFYTIVRSYASRTQTSTGRLKPCRLYVKCS
ncbi:hypothetical protein NEISUBOT_04702 [Neisseria subflava NJ9703]|uniref:Uncharacterized protein n=1 Tax=Neisseria subflava NJ9703 TaxID=546268 RepID=A0A9W5MZ99_NEISU|nr:hypothetical protein NEISUBOT_04702 [Neisseria subflava NJ9703]